jgi:hypothetical protein
MDITLHQKEDHFILYSNLNYSVTSQRPDLSTPGLIFDLINSNMLNEYLDSFMKGLTAKVWRTYNASYLFQKEIDKLQKELDKLKNG